MTAGSYLLLLTVDQPCDITVGRLGRRSYPHGDYLYCGSALGGLEARLARHERREKRLHWHIDYLLAQATLMGAWVMPGTMRLECLAQQALCRLGGAPVRGFGSSDCRCPGHLLFFAEAPTLGDFKRAMGESYAAALAVHRWRPRDPTE